MKKTKKDTLLFRPLKMGRNFVFGCVLIFLFSTQNQILQIMIELGLVINHNKVLTVVMRTTF